LENLFKISNTKYLIWMERGVTKVSHILIFCSSKN
jgi:hypothetical protein